MNINVVLGPWLPMPPVRGGAMQKSWYGLAREFVRAGESVAVFAKRFPGQSDRETLEGITIARTLGFAQGRSIVWDLVKDFVYAANLAPRLAPADVLVTNDFWLPVVADLANRSAGALVVCAARFPKGQYFLYRRAKRIIAISSAVGAAIVAEDPSLASRTEVIPLPVDLELLSNGAIPGRKRGRTVLFVGRIHPEKGVEMLLGAWTRVEKEFPAWRLRIVGPFAAADGGGGPQFEARVRELARGHAVDFEGPLFDQSALADVYRGADVFCYPSIADRGEAFGAAALEAMAAGVPPIVSALDCFRDFVRDGGNGWVFDHRAMDPQARLAERLRQAMGNAAAREHLSHEARKDAGRFGFPAIAQRYLAEFDRMLSSFK